MKKLIFILVFLLSAGLISVAQNGKCNVVYQGKKVFVNSIPTDAYTVIAKTKYPASGKNDAASAGDVSGIYKVVLTLDEALEKVQKGKIGDFDAIIVYGILKMELIKFNDASPTYQCTYNVKDYMKKCGAITVYYLGLPIKEYDVVKSIEVTNFTNLGQLKMGKDDIDNFMNKLYESACKEAKDSGLIFDGIIMDDPDMAMKKGFIGGRTIQLIKMK